MSNTMFHVFALYHCSNYANVSNVGQVKAFSSLLFYGINTAPQLEDMTTGEWKGQKCLRLKFS